MFTQRPIIVGTAPAQCLSYHAVKTEMWLVQDSTETNLINLRRTIYLTIMSGLTFEETGHKLMKIELQPGQEFEVASMILECCSQEKSFSK